MKRLKHDKRAVSNAIVVMLSLVLVVIIVANVVLWSYQMNQLDWEKMQEDVKITDVARVGEAWSYNPSGYAPSGSTSLVSGSISNLTSDDGVDMIFRSYGSSTTVTYPITNMNFTGDATGWTTTTSVVSGTATSGYDSADGNPSPGSGVGSYYHNGTGTVPKVADINFTTETSLNYTYGTPVSVYLSYAYKLSGTSIAATGNSLIIRLVKPDLTTTDLDTVSFTGAVAWTYKTIVVDTTHFSQSGTYELRVLNRILTAVKGTANYAQLNFDDIGLKITYNSEYTMEVEFTETSNTEDWTQLIWTVDSAWTISSVNVTLQLYNYTLNGYPTSGNGYIAYTSDDIPNTDEAKNQTITVNPTDFRNATGYWRMKIKGVKATDTQFDFKADWIEFKVVSDGGTLFTFENAGSLTSHVVSLWVINSTNHRRYDANLFMNAGEEAVYIRADIRLPSGAFIAKVVTERGNLAVFARN